MTPMGIPGRSIPDHAIPDHSIPGYKASYSFSSSSASSTAPLCFPTLSRGVDLRIAEPIRDTNQWVTPEDEGRMGVKTAGYRASHHVQLSVSWMTDADRIALARFYLSTTIGGVKVWEWTHPKTGQTYLLRFDPASPPIWSREVRQPDKHHAEIAAVEDIADGYLTGVYP